MNLFSIYNKLLSKLVTIEKDTFVDKKAITHLFDRSGLEPETTQEGGGGEVGHG